MNDLPQITTWYAFARWPLGLVLAIGATFGAGILLLVGLHQAWRRPSTRGAIIYCTAVLLPAVFGLLLTVLILCGVEERILDGIGDYDRSVVANMELKRLTVALVGVASTLLLSPLAIYCVTRIRDEKNAS